MTLAELSVSFLLVCFLPGWASAQQVGDAIHPTTLQLQALSGAFASSDEPDLSVSFYEQDGQLFTESEHQLPAPLTAVSPTEFTSKGDRYSFSLDASHRPSAVTIVNQGDPTKYLMTRTGEAVHHAFPPYERQEATIPMRDGIKLHAVILKPSAAPGPLPIPDGPHSLWRGWLYHGQPL